MELRQHILGRYKVLCIFSLVFFGIFMFITFFIYSRPIVIEDDYEGNENTDDWDVFVFAQQWLPSYNSNLKKANWTIHGVWPNNSTYCREFPFDVNEVESIRDKLIQFWPTYENITGDIFNDSIKFWDHEWTKHGTCAMSIPGMESILSYFSTGLDWYNKYDLLSALEKSNITPNATQGYNVSDIVNSIMSVYEKEPVIVCTDNNQLAEIRLCLDKSSQLVDCSNNIINCNISNEVFYSPINSDNDNWDIFVFAQQWLPSYNLDMKKANWTIHGVWPNNSTDDGPSNCREVPFDVNAVQPIKDQLVQFWPTYNNFTGDIYNDSIKFWNHEWTKHGTCAMSVPGMDTILSYFSAGLDWHNKYDLLSALEKSNITPNATQGYNVTDIVNSIISVYETVPVIVCKENNQLAEIKLCLDKASQLINCTTSVSICDSTKEIYYIPIDSEAQHLPV